MIQAFRSPAVQLFLISLCSLYLELLCISWMSANIRAFSVFKTFPLVTCFIGLGLGCAWSSNRLAKLIPHGILLFVMVMQIANHTLVGKLVFPSKGVFSWTSELWTNLGPNWWYYTCICTLLLFLVLLGPFAMMITQGARLGQLFGELPPLRAYCVNITGAIAGSVLFTAASFLELSPNILLIPMALLAALCTPTSTVSRAIGFVLICAASLLIPSPTEATVTYWSPYQRLDVAKFALESGNTPGELYPNGLVIGANRSFYQYGLDLREENINRADRTEKDKERLTEHARHYNLPYQFIKPRRVLVLGCGLGNDVCAALRHGATSVDAVDIDPIILKLGKKYHPEKPYANPGVTAYCDDARDFLNKKHEPYDLIVFAGLDSHAATGQSSSIRIDNYVYTRESMSKALEVLAPKGLIFLSFCNPQEWLRQKLFYTMKAACGYEPIIFQDTTKPFLRWELFVVGKDVKDRTLTIPPDISPFKEKVAPVASKAKLLTDDWPYLYVAPIGVDIPYLFVVMCVIVITVAASHRLLFRPQPANHWQMFFLGAAFLLLELMSIGRLCILYGATWLTSSVVINGVLLLILSANLLVLKASARIPKPSVLYSSLIISLAVSYILPVNDILSRTAGTWGLGPAIVTLVTLFPIYFAGLIFATAFRSVTNPGMALGFNLLGSVGGAMLEYTSNFTGIRSLVLISIVLYVISWFFQSKSTAAPSERSAVPEPIGGAPEPSSGGAGDGI